jgi:hypothetical protein
MIRFNDGGRAAFVVVAMLTIGWGGASAQNISAAASQTFEKNAAAFVEAADYTLIDAGSLADQNYYSLQRFPSMGAGSMFSPDSDLDAVTRAVLLLESREAELPHVRYRITYNVESLPDIPEAQQAYIEVTRYNMGPTLRADLLKSIPAEHVANSASFGVGPHVSWRFVMAARMGMLADVERASRKELTQAQAAAADCLGEPCLSLSDAEGPVGKWRPAQPPTVAGPRYARGSGSVDHPARVAQELLAAAAPDGLEPADYKPDSPRMVFVISLNVSGQDEAAMGLLHDAMVMDDAIAEIWTRRQQFAGGPADFAQFFAPR